MWIIHCGCDGCDNRQVEMMIQDLQYIDIPECQNKRTGCGLGAPYLYLFGLEGSNSKTVNRVSYLKLKHKLNIYVRSEAPNRRESTLIVLSFCAHRYTRACLYFVLTETGAKRLGRITLRQTRTQSQHDMLPSVSSDLRMYISSAAFRFKYNIRFDFIIYKLFDFYKTLNIMSGMKMHCKYVYVSIYETVNAQHLTFLESLSSFMTSDF